ncbi:hypothetical protein K469DRAFT_745031 [Zopfia rhizophila CBS 207.26]|uniref:Cleavage/polyadenylation specificity factor A subunit N-terminal domain-containing protein n=1 Tax=Zopfia rhizophila CBS 207.26 TaxID=1314779 RepID=A0A6A6EU39_9PEZI|nr:hypothetical protein K469DRAFT_745031 [Zopfia rhizophila CBS 207.26]
MAPRIWPFRRGSTSTRASTSGSSGNSKLSTDGKPREHQLMKSRTIYSSGLSPDCKVAFLLDETALTMYHLDQHTFHPFPAFINSSGAFKDAVISDNFLAIITKSSLEVWILQVEQQTVGQHVSIMIPPSNGVPECLAIYQSQTVLNQAQEVFVAIGSRSSSMIGEVHVYHVNFTPEASSTLPQSSGKGALTSATIFATRSGQHYILGTTSPSTERKTHSGAEFSFLSPVEDGNGVVPLAKQHNILHFTGTILLGAVTSFGEYVVFLEPSGQLSLMDVHLETNGHLVCRRVITKFDGLCKQAWAPPTSLRFQQTYDGLKCFAMDIKGKLIIKAIPQLSCPAVLSSVLPGPDTLVEAQDREPAELIGERRREEMQG